MRLRVLGALCVVFALGAVPSYAQTIGGGVKVGVNFANISQSGDEDDDLDTRTGLAVGGYADFGLTDLVSFQPEVLFTQKGAKLGEEDGDDFKLNIDGVQIPLLVKLKFGNGFIVAGPGLNFITSAKIEFGDDEEDIKDDVASVDFSGIIGAGVRLGPATVEARYDHGFNDLDDDDLNEAKSRTFTILVGFGR